MNDSFVSVVMDQNNIENLLVRARREGDLEALFPELNLMVFATPTHDYPFRTSINRQEVAATLARRLLGIAYPNFKASVEDEARGDVYGDVWAQTLSGFGLDRPRAHEIQELQSMGGPVEYFCHRCGNTYEDDPEGECPGL